MFNWLRELFEIRYEFRERNAKLTHENLVEKSVCQSCETLKQQLEIANYEKEKLLSRILEKPEEPAKTEPVPITPPRMIPWNVRRQMLEREDREKAKLMRDAPKPDSEKANVADLERELDIASAEREAQTVSGGAKQTP